MMNKFNHWAKKVQYGVTILGISIIVMVLVAAAGYTAVGSYRDCSWGEHLFYGKSIGMAWMLGWCHG